MLYFRTWQLYFYTVYYIKNIDKFIRAKPMNSINIIEKFVNNDDACSEYLCRLRWNKTPQCPYCSSTKTGIRKKRRPKTYAVEMSFLQ